MGTKRESISTKEYPPNDSKFPARSSRGVEPLLPPFKPIVGQLGPYELIAELGSGGMGTVYVARRTYEGGVTRTVALKTLRKDLAYQPDLVEMFMDEARITSRISHPYVCTVMDIGSADGVPFVTMDYLIGEPLSRLAPLMQAEQTEVSIASILRVIANLCEGLHAAHEQRDDGGKAMDVVHRDISPDNLFVLYDGSVRVADFGIALTGENQKSGKSSTLAGKSGYMSPEQIRGQMLDRRADVWSMGVVLWELLTGQRLFRPGTEIAATVAVLERPIDSPSKFNKLVPSGLDAVVRKALHRDRDHRYPTARAMALELENVLTRCFGPVSAARLSGWLDDLFPGCQEFRRTIVLRSQAWLKQQGSSLEFDPSTDAFSSPGMVIPSSIGKNLDLLALAHGALTPPSTNFSSLDVGGRGAADPLEDTSIIPVQLQHPNPKPRGHDSLENLDVELSDEHQAKHAQEAIAAQLAATPAAGMHGTAATPHASPLRMYVAPFVGGLLLVGLIALFSGPGPEKVGAAKKVAPQATTVAPAAVAHEPAAAVPQVLPPRAESPAKQVAPEPAVVQPAAAPAPVSEKPVIVQAEKPVEPAAAVVVPKPRVKAPELVKPAAAVPGKTDTGDVYVFAKSGEVFVLINGKEIHAPALLHLPIDTEALTVRHGVGGPVTQVAVKPMPGRPIMLKLE